MVSVAHIDSIISSLTLNKATTASISNSKVIAMLRMSHVTHIDLQETKRAIEVALPASSRLSSKT